MNFSTIITVVQSPQEVFSRITQDVSKWWGGADLTGSTTQLNDEFIIHHHGAHYSKQRIVELVLNEKIVWKVIESKLNWLQKDQQEWTNTKMIFELTTKGDQTALHFMHEGLTPDKECYALCHEGWNTVIKDYLFHLIKDDQSHF